MGATTFHVEVKANKTNGRTDREAFQNAVQQARFENGHGGYTGTIAEKGSFIRTATAPTFAAGRKLADPDAPAVEDKWGPAGCITIQRPGKPVQGFIFYGWASE